jgi:hypothetical protein
MLCHFAFTDPRRTFRSRIGVAFRGAAGSLADIVRAAAFGAYLPKIYLTGPGAYYIMKNRVNA